MPGFQIISVVASSCLKVYEWQRIRQRQEPVHFSDIMPHAQMCMMIFNPFAHRYKAKIVCKIICNFGLSECSSVKQLINFNLPQNEFLVSGDNSF